MSNEIYQATGPGSEYLKYPILQYIMTNEPFLGTFREGIPDGPFNRELLKLLKNDEALVALFDGYLKRTFGATLAAAPVVDVVPIPLVGQPSTPADKAVHTVYYSNYEVLYAYNGTLGEWEEKARMARSVYSYVKHVATVVVNLGTGENDVNFALPTEDDDSTAHVYTMADLKSFHVVGVDANFVSAEVMLIGAQPKVRPIVITNMTGTPTAVLTFESFERIS